MQELTQQELIELVGELTQQVNELSWNDGYGCYTRQGFEKVMWPRIAAEARHIIFFDVDNMHGINEKHGYDGANNLIKDSLAMRGSDFMAGQWFSGDEFIVVITDDPGRVHESNPMEFAARLREIFFEHNISATFAIAPVISEDLYTNVAPAHHKVQEAKNSGRRGTLNEVGGAR